MYKCQSQSFDEKDYYTIDNQEMQTDPDHNDHYFPATPMVIYSGDVNVPADKMDRRERFPVDAGPSLGPFLSTLCFLIDPSFQDPEVFFNSLFDERMGPIIAGQTHIYARSKIRTAQQVNNATDAMSHFNHRQHAHHNTWRDVRAEDIKFSWLV